MSVTEVCAYMQWLIGVLMRDRCLMISIPVMGIIVSKLWWSLVNPWQYPHPPLPASKGKGPWRPTSSTWCWESPISWIFLSICPFVCAWYSEERLMVTPRRVKNDFQTWEMNCGPRSETISSGRPKLRKTWLNINSSISMAVGKLLRDTNWQALENLSTITRMQALPSEGGRLVTKSTPRCDQGQHGTGSGRSLPAGKWREVFEMVQSWHPCTNFLMSCAMLDHQKQPLNSERVWLAPGWPVPTEEWTDVIRGILWVLWTPWRN